MQEERVEESDGRKPVHPAIESATKALQATFLEIPQVPPGICENVAVGEQMHTAAESFKKQELLRRSLKQADMTRRQQKARGKDVDWYTVRKEIEVGNDIFCPAFSYPLIDFGQHDYSDDEVELNVGDQCNTSLHRQQCIALEQSENRAKKKWN